METNVLMSAGIAHLSVAGCPTPRNKQGAVDAGTQSGTLCQVVQWQTKHAYGHKTVICLTRCQIAWPQSALVCVILPLTQ